MILLTGTTGKCCRGWGAVSSDSSFKILTGSISGPNALLTLGFCSSCKPVEWLHGYLVLCVMGLLLVEVSQTCFL